MSVFITSDWHFGHRLAARLRGFSSVEEHDAYILDGVLSTVKSRDKLYVLGDVSFRIRELYSYVGMMPGHKVLVFGNHDRNHVSKYLAAGFSNVVGAWQDDGFILTHIPIHPQEILRFRANIHGHVHNGGITINPEGRYYNVNVEFNNYMPVPFEHIAERYPEIERPTYEHLAK